MEEPTLGYDDFCQILGRVSLESYLRFEQFNRDYLRQIEALKVQLAQKDRELADKHKTIEVLQANLDMQRS